MSFSFKDLFAQGKSLDASGGAESVQPPGRPTEIAKPVKAKGGANPFSSGPFSNIFSDGSEGADSAHLETAGQPGQPFIPNPQPTGRGSFEALFSGQGLGMKPESSGASGRYTVREILPFIPPALAAQGSLPMDREVLIELPADGSHEVRLSTIQSVCPEIFATAINPLNDSELTLPPPASTAKRAATQPSEAASGLPIRQAAEAGNGQRPSIFGAAQTDRSLAKAPTNRTPIADSDSSATLRPDRPMVGNPFSAAASELAETPGKTAVAAGPFSQPETPAKSVGFGFPPAKESASPFGAFGNPPTPVSKSLEPVAAAGSNAWSAPAAAPAFGFDLGKEFGPFESGPAARPATIPANVSLPRPAESESPPHQAEPQPQSKPATPLPWDTPKPQPLGHGPSGGTPAGSPAGPPAVGNPFGGSSLPEPGENPFAFPGSGGDGSHFGTSPLSAGHETGQKGSQSANPFDLPAAEEPSAADKPWPFQGGWSLPGSQESSGPEPVKPAPSSPSPEADAIPEQPAETPPQPKASGQNPLPTMSFGWPGLNEPPSGVSFFDTPAQEDPKPTFPSATAPPSQPLPAPEPVAVKKEEPEAVATVNFTLAELVRPVTSQAGIDPATVPPGAKVRLPICLIEPQLSTGAVSVTIADLIRHGDADSAAALKGAPADFPIILPQNELFHQISDLAPDLVPESDEELEAQFMTLFAAEAETDSAIQWPAQLIEPEPRPQAPTSPQPAAPSGIQAKATESIVVKPKEPTPQIVSPKPSEQPSAAAPAAPKPSMEKPLQRDPFAPLPRKAAPAANPPAVDPSPQSDDDPDSAYFDDLNQFSAAATPITPTSSASREEEEEDQSSLTSDKTFPMDDEAWGFSGFASLDDLEPEAPRPVPAKPKAPSQKISVSVQPNPPSPKPSRGFFEELESSQPSKPKHPRKAASPSPSYHQQVPATRQETAQGNSRHPLRDIELRAVFGTDEEFTYVRVADLTASLPGIAACAIVAPGFTAQAPRGRESGDLAIQAGALLNGVREIARITGMNNAETFTLHTDQGVLSVFIHGDHCLTVRHDDGQFDPGVREKLILVTRGLGGLEN